MKHVVERWVLGESPDDIWSPTPFVTRKAAQAHLDRLQPASEYWADLKIYKQTTITEPDSGAKQPDVEEPE